MIYLVEIVLKNPELLFKSLAKTWIITCFHGRLDGIGIDQKSDMVSDHKKYILNIVTQKLMLITSDPFLNTSSNFDSHILSQLEVKVVQIHYLPLTIPQELS